MMSFLKKIQPFFFLFLLFLSFLWSCNRQKIYNYRIKRNGYLIVNAKIEGWERNVRGHKNAVYNYLYYKFEYKGKEYEGRRDFIKPFACAQNGSVVIAKDDPDLNFLLYKKEEYQEFGKTVSFDEGIIH
jgi:hypothetical protein